MGLHLNLLRKLHLVIRGPPELRQSLCQQAARRPTPQQKLSLPKHKSKPYKATKQQRNERNIPTRQSVSQSICQRAPTAKEKETTVPTETRDFSIQNAPTAPHIPTRNCEKANTRTHKHTKHKTEREHKEMKAFRSTSGVSAGPPPPPSSSHKKSMHSQVLQHNHQHKITTMTQQREAPRSPSTPQSPMDEAGHFSIQLEDIIKNKSYRACYLKFLESSRCTGMCVVVFFL